MIEACGNTLLLIAAQPIFGVLQTEPRALEARRRFHRAINEQHREIAAAIEAGDDRRGRRRDARAPRVPPAVLRAGLAAAPIDVTLTRPRSASRAAASWSAALPDPGHFRRVAQAAEELGFDSLWAGDHVSFHKPILDVTVALATFAAVTERIRSAPGVVLLPLRAAERSSRRSSPRSTTSRAGA